MTIVVDASAMLAWCFEDEAPPNAADLLDEFVAEGIVVPVIWTLELANILNQGLRKGRLKQAMLEEFVALIDALGVVPDLEGYERALVETRALAAAEKLTVYDASYLELALRLKARLASKDTALIGAARRHKVKVIDFST